MSSLTAKRLMVVIVSQILGFIISFLIITVGFDALPLFTTIQTPQGVSIARYGILYFLATAIPIGITVMIWMDAFLDTRILPD